MNKQFTYDLLKAIYILWVLSGILSIAGLLVLFTFDENALFELSSVLSDYHEQQCILCGITQGCVYIASGNISGALRSNPISLLFVVLLFSNSFLFLTYFFKKLFKINISNKYEYS